MKYLFDGFACIDDVKFNAVLTAAKSCIEQTGINAAGYRIHCGIIFLQKITGENESEFCTMANELTTVQKKEWAQMLYVQNQLTQKEIAAKVKVTESTMSKWVNAGSWEKLRKSLLTTKSEILSFLYNVLDKIKAKVEAEDGIGDSKTADMVVKYTAAIKSMETETSIAVLMDAGTEFYKHLQAIDPAKALDFLNEYDGFIKNKMKKF